MNDDKFDKHFDLEPSEFRELDVPQPFWGFNAKTTAILFLVGIISNVILTRLIYGSFPYWIQSFLG